MFAYLNSWQKRKRETETRIHRGKRQCRRVYTDDAGFREEKSWRKCCTYVVNEDTNTLCTTPAQTGKSKTGPRCGRHGGGKKRGICTHIEPETSTRCTTLAIAGKDLCAKHGGRGFCTHIDPDSNTRCPSAAVGKDLCAKHGGRGFCTHIDPETSARCPTPATPGKDLLLSSLMFIDPADMGYVVL